MLCSLASLFFCPKAALPQTGRRVISLIGPHGGKNPAGKLWAKAAVVEPPALAAGLHRALAAPERQCHGKAACAVDLRLTLTVVAADAASRFKHGYTPPRRS